MELPSTLCSNVYDFAFCPEPCYDRLVDLADPEDWGPGNRILKNYLSFSFSRAVFLTERDLDQTGPSNLPLVFDNDRCLFNTGLYTRRYETIYGLFEPNTKPDARQRWFLKGFFKESDPMLVSFDTCRAACALPRTPPSWSLTTACPSVPTSTTFWAMRRTLRASQPA